MEGYFTLKFLFATEKSFFSGTTVLLGGSSVKILTELYNLTKLLCFGLCHGAIVFPSLIHQKFFLIIIHQKFFLIIIHQKFFLAYANLVTTLI